MILKIPLEPKQTQESDSLVNDSFSGNKRIEPSEQVNKGGVKG